MPQSLVMAVGAGIGLFIAFIGLCEQLISYASWHIHQCKEAPTGLGVIGGDTVNLVGLGGCTAERMWCKPFTRRATDSLVKISLMVYRGTVLAMCCKALLCGLEFSSEGVSQVLSPQ
jgi:xanthine/uracil/vitamin C permease (AzgA family)